MSEQEKEDSLDHEVLWPILDRVARGTITVRPNEYGYPWYRDGDRHCQFTGYLLDKLTEQEFVRWDRMIEGPQGRLIVRDDGISAVKLDDKGYELHKRLSTEHVLDRERAACTASPICGLSAVCGRCGWKTWPSQVTSVHLIAGNQVTDRYLPGGLIAVCGEVVDTSTSYSLEPNADPAYCPDCVAAALDWNQRALARWQAARDPAARKSAIR